MDYQAIIKAHKLKPVIVNPKSKFVVCTYWWGRGNANKNFWRFGNEITDAEVKEIGIEWCKYQSKELMDRGVPVLHYYTMGKSDAVKKIAESLF
jgi:hypothetical protein